MHAVDRLIGGIVSYLLADVLWVWFIIIPCRVNLNRSLDTGLYLMIL